MKILITGATGFLGKRLTEKLLEENKFEEIIATGRNEIIGKELDKLGATFVKGNLENKDFVKDIVKNTDIIAHSAALAAPWGRYNDFYAANVLSAQHLLDAALETGIKRFVHISTPSIYFTGTDRFDVKEDDPLPQKFSNFYAATKYEAEKLVGKAFEKGLETIVLRPRAIIGAGDNAIMPRLLTAQQAGKLKIIGNGNAIADLSAVSNVVSAILLSIITENREAFGKAYNITNGNPIKLWEYISWVLGQLGLSLNQSKIPYSIALATAGVAEWIATVTRSSKEPPLTRQGIGILAKSCTLNIERAKTILGYQPIQTNEEAAKEFLAWWKSK
jgi:nucleoside-diphosphate-sugar epimerase